MKENLEMNGIKNGAGDTDENKPIKIETINKRK